MSMLDFLDLNFITSRVMPYLDRGLLMSLQLIVPAALIGGFIGGRAAASDRASE